MKSFTLILKGILLWLTVFSFLIFIVGAESLIEQKLYLVAWCWLIINVVFVLFSRCIISDKEFQKLSLLQWVNKQLSTINKNKNERRI